MEVSELLSSLAQQLNLLNFQVVADTCAESDMVNVAATLERLKESVTKCRQSMNIEMDRLKKAKETCCYVLDSLKLSSSMPLHPQSPAISKFSHQKNPSPPLPLSSSSSSVPFTGTTTIIGSSSFPKIEDVTEQEFSIVPKYMKGRLSREKINNGVGFINKVIAEKYTLLGQNPTKMSIELRQRFYELRDSECDKVLGKFFITENDIKIVMASGKDASMFKLDSTGRAILAILRHLGRIKEARTAGTIRFIIYGQ